MTRKRMAVVATTLSFCLLVGGMAYLGWDDWFPPPPGINPRNFARLRTGMPTADLRKILGQPKTPLVNGGFVGGVGWQDWSGDDFYIVIHHNDGKIVDGRCQKAGVDVCPSLAERDLAGRVRRWLGR